MIRRVPIPQYFSNRLKSNRVLQTFLYDLFFYFNAKDMDDVSKTRVKLIQGEQQLSLLRILILSLLLRAPLILDDAIALDTRNTTVKELLFLPRYLKCFFCIVGINHFDIQQVQVNRSRKISRYLH